MDQENKKIKIVIVGAGFAGIRIALDLEESLTNIEITIINDTPYHSYHPDLYEITSATIENERKIDFKDISSSVNIPLSKIFKGKKIKQIIDETISINLDEKYIFTKHNNRVDFDYLVLSAGAETSYFGIPGAQNYSHPLKNTEDALNIRNDIEELIYASIHPIQIIIAGGGFTGVEIAGSLQAFVKKLAKKYNKPLSKVCIVELQNGVLNGLPAWVQNTAKKKLRSLGVTLYLEEKIDHVEPNLLFTDKRQLQSDYLIWTTGIQANPLVAQLTQLKQSRSHQILTSIDLSIPNYPNVFVVGDNALVIDPKTSHPVPATSWAALSQAKTATTNIIASIDQRPRIAYSPNNPGFVIPIGERYAISTALNLRLTGFLAWGLKRFIALKYFLSILSPKDAYDIWQKGLTIDINSSKPE